MNNMYDDHRKSYIQLNEIYFWTATIHNWENLLNTDEAKSIIIDSLAFLSNNNIIDVFAFVIMPNHIHLIWRINSLNGKETAQGSLLKFTAHSSIGWCPHQPKSVILKMGNNTKLIMSSFIKPSAAPSVFFRQLC